MQNLKVMVLCRSIPHKETAAFIFVSCFAGNRPDMAK